MSAQNHGFSTILALLLAFSSARGSDFVVLEPLPPSHWPEGALTWRMVGKWPVASARSVRRAFGSDPTFVESPCGVVVVRYAHQRDKFGLFPGTVACVGFTETAPELSIIGCGVNVNGKVIRSYGKASKSKFVELLRIIKHGK